MKIILFLLISLNVFAQTAEEIRIQQVKDDLTVINIPDNSKASQEIIAGLIPKCGIVFNSAFFYDELLKITSTADLDCFKAKKSELDTDIINRANAKASRDTAKTSMEDFNCTTIPQPYLKLLCESRK